MSSQSNILISQLIEDPNFEEDDDDVENENIPMIPDGQINMRFGHSGGPDMLNDMLNLPYYHLKALCYHGHTESLGRLIDRFDLFKNKPEIYSDFSLELEREVNYEGRIFGTGVEYIAQLLSLSYGTQIFALARDGDDLWGADEEPCHIINGYDKDRHFIINFEVNEDNGYIQEPDFFKKLHNKMNQYNEKIITPEFEKYYIKPLERGFSIKYNMVLGLQILNYREQIKEQLEKNTIGQLYEGFMLKEKDSLFED